MNIEQITKIFYAKYGLAMHNAQALECGLLELYAIKRYIIDGITENEYYRILGNPKKWTLGKIYSLITKLSIFDNETLEKLRKANQYRIFLAHNFWWERDIELENPRSLWKLHEELGQHVLFLNELLHVVDIKINAIRKESNLNIEEKMGLTDFQERLAYIKKLKESKT